MQIREGIEKGSSVPITFVFIGVARNIYRRFTTFSSCLFHVLLECLGMYKTNYFCFGNYTRISSLKT